MSAKKLMKQYTADEITESFVVTEKLTVKQKKEAGLQLKEARKKAQSGMTEKERLVSRVLQLKFQIEDYLNSERFNPKFTFGYFLSAYVTLLNKKRKNFAQEIDIAETELSQLINTHRLPNENILIRLEIHSNNSIPAVVWYKIIEKGKEYSIRTNKALRQQEKKYVTNKLPVDIG
jgi:plasmid maintenance system antidote protein VapI